MPRLGLALAAGVAVTDQLVKWWAIETLMAAPEGIEVLPVFNLVMVWNRGISFGMFGDAALPPLLLAGFAGAVAIALGVWLMRAEGRWLALGLGLIIGGAVGNIVDRLRFGAVADFLDFHISAYHWPAFNLADASITVGVALLLIDALLIRRERHK